MASFNKARVPRTVPTAPKTDKMIASAPVLLIPISSHEVPNYRTWCQHFTGEILFGGVLPLIIIGIYIYLIIKLIEILPVI